MGQVGVLPPRVDSNLQVAARLHRLPVRIGDTFGRVAVCLAGVDAVHVVAEGVQRVTARAGGERVHIHGGHSHHRTCQLLRVQLFEGQKDRKSSFRFVAVGGAVDPEAGARLAAVDDEEGDGLGAPGHVVANFEDAPLKFPRPGRHAADRHCLVHGLIPSVLWRVSTPAIRSNARSSNSSGCSTLMRSQSTHFSPKAVPGKIRTCPSLSSR